MQRRWIAGLIGLVACSAPSAQKPDVATKPPEPVAPPAVVTHPAPVELAPEPVEPPRPSGPYVVGTVKDEKGALVQGIELAASVGKDSTFRVLGNGISNERGEFQFEVEVGAATLSVQLSRRKPLEETFHDGENRIDVVVDSKLVAKARKDDYVRACPSSAPGTVLAGHTTSQKDIDDIAHMLLERGKDVIPDWDLAARGAHGGIAVIADIGYDRQITKVALPAGFRLADAKALQAEADVSRNQLGFLSFHDIWSDGSCATVTVGGDIAVPADPNTMKMCCCSETTLYEKKDGKWTRTGNVVTSCS